MEEAALRGQNCSQGDHLAQLEHLVLHLQYSLNPFRRIETHFLKKTTQVWKARVNGYEEATKLFQQWDEDDPKWKGISLKIKLCKRLILMTIATDGWA